MEGRCTGVDTSPSPFSSAASPLCEVGFVDHHLRLFPEVVVIKDSVAQCPDTADTVLNFCLDGGFLGQVTP